MLTDQTSGLELHLEADEEAGAEELERMTGRLRCELLLLDVGDVQRMPDAEPPEGARGIDPGAIGSLLVSLVSGPDVLQAVVRVVRDWLGRSRARSAYLQIDGDVLHVTGISSAEQDRLIKDWLTRHAGS